MDGSDGGCAGGCVAPVDSPGVCSSVLHHGHSLYPPPAKGEPNCFLQKPHDDTISEPHLWVLNRYMDKSTCHECAGSVGHLGKE